MYIPYSYMRLWAKQESREILKSHIGAHAMVEIRSSGGLPHPKGPCTKYEVAAKNPNYATRDREALNTLYVPETPDTGFFIRN